MRTKAVMIGALGLISLGGVLAGAAQAEEIVAHTGATEPLLEGFNDDLTGVSLSGPVLGDMGLDAYAVGGTGMERFGTGDFDAATRAELLARGWKMTARLRVAQSPDERGLVAVNLENIGGRRYDMNFGLDANGDTFVRLNQTIVTSPQLTGIGPTHTLVGSGSTYHLFELIYDPAEASADLFVDGVEVMSDYEGHTTFVRQLGFYFAAYQSYVGNIAEARFEFLDCPCNEADLGAPFGTLDFTDVIAFLGAFGAGEQAADLAPPFGTFDFSDVLAFLGAFGAGCP